MAWRDTAIREKESAMMPPPPPFCQITDIEGATHILRMHKICRVSLAGTEDTPQVEIWVQFGGNIRLSGEQAAHFLTTFRGWAEVVIPPERPRHY